MIELKWINTPMSVCRMDDLSAVQWDAPYVFAARTPEEYSLVCPTNCVPSGVQSREDGWRMLRVCGTMEFSLVGILSGLSGVLAQSGVSLFAVSTYDTDYLLVKAEQSAQAEAALTKAGYIWRANEA